MDIYELSHSINSSSNSGKQQAESPGTTAKKAGRPKKPTTTMQDDTPAPPPRQRTPPPPSATKTAKVVQEKTKDDKEKRRAQLIKKIRMYKAHRHLREYFMEIDVPLKLDNLSDADLEGIYASMLMALECNFRETQVRSMFEMVFVGIEKACSMFIHDVEWQGLAEAACENIDSFDPELSQVAVELSDSLIPDPKLRLAFKMFTFASNFRKAQLLQPGDPTFKKGQSAQQNVNVTQANISRSFND